MPLDMSLRPACPQISLLLLFHAVNPMSHFGLKSCPQTGTIQTMEFDSMQIHHLVFTLVGDGKHEVLNRGRVRR